MKNNIALTIKNRMSVVGITQSKLSQEIQTTQNQLSLFLQGKSSLNIKALNKCFDVLNIPLYGITKRIELAQEAARRLTGFSSKDISVMTRREMIEETGLKNIRALPTVSKYEFKLMKESGVGDFESTYQHFKTLVIHFHKTGGRLTPKSVEDSFSDLYTHFFHFIVPSTMNLFTAGINALISKDTSLMDAIDSTLDSTWDRITLLTERIFDEENKNK